MEWLKLLHCKTRRLGMYVSGRGKCVHRPERTAYLRSSQCTMIMSTSRCTSIMFADEPVSDKEIALLRSIEIVFAPNFTLSDSSSGVMQQILL